MKTYVKLHYILSVSVRSYGQNKVLLWGSYKVRGQNGVSGNYMHAIIELTAHKASEIWIRLPHTFTTEGSSQVSRVCVASV